MYPKNSLIDILQSLNESDPNMIMKLQDLIDILYKLNRIQNNGYDSSYVRRLNNKAPSARAQDVIRNFSMNLDKDSKRSAENFIGILQNMEEMKHNMDSSVRKQTLSTGNSYDEGNDMVEKIKNFFKSLND